MKSSWDLYGCKTSLRSYHLSETMNTGSREAVTERQWFWLSGVAGKLFSVISYLHLTLKPRGEPNSFLSSDPRSSEAWRTGYHKICCLSKLRLNYIHVLLHGNLYLKAFIFTTSYTRIQLRKLLHKTSQTCRLPLDTSLRHELKQFERLRLNVDIPGQIKRMDIHRL